MATAYKVLAQSAPAANATVNVYTVPAATQAVISTLSIVNRSTSAINYRLAVRPAGAALADQHWIIYDQPTDPFDTLFLTLGMTLGAGDVVTVVAGTPSGLSLTLFGSEIT